jgi:hypothetical protein
MRFFREMAMPAAFDAIPIVGFDDVLDIESAEAASAAIPAADFVVMPGER